VEAGIAVGEAIAELPPPVRRAVRSFYFGGETIRMIAAHESRPEGTIKRWLHEGREALRMALAEAPESAPLARVYASDWLADAERDVLGALTEAGYRAERCELPEDESPPTDAALYVFGQQAGARSGLELLLALRASDGGAHLPTVLFGPSRHTAILAAWQAGADVYLTDPSSPELSHFLRKLRDMPAPRDMAPQ
jgi:CheY-like chemotaxis protein